MGQDTSISWTDATWNPIRGCSRVSAGCEHCYAEQVAARFSGPGLAYEGLARRRSNGKAQWTGVVRVIESHIKDPLRWQKPRRIFVNSMSDLFHENLPDEQIDRIYAVMALAGRHTFQVLTKRPERMASYLAGLADRGGRARGFARLEAAARGLGYALSFEGQPLLSWPILNIWHGTSIEDARVMDRADHLRAIRRDSVVNFVSYEPALGPLDDLDMTGIDWVIYGGESGRDRRPDDDAWARAMLAKCRASGAAFFYKQMSAARSGTRPTLDGVSYHEFPTPRHIAFQHSLAESYVNNP